MESHKESLAKAKELKPLKCATGSSGGTGAATGAATGSAPEAAPAKSASGPVAAPKAKAAEEKKKVA